MDSRDDEGHENLTNPRQVRIGALLWIIGTIVFVIGMIVTQLGYPSYSLTQNHISDLGAVYCSAIPSLGISGGQLYDGYVCSPWHDVFNATIVVEGIFLVLGTVFIQLGITNGEARSNGLALLAAAGIGSAGVGIFPEDTIFLAHSLSALLVFVPGNLALIGLGFRSYRGLGSFRFRVYSIFSGLVGLVAFLLFILMISGPIGAGGMERLAAGPLILWIVVAGVAFLQSARR